MLKKSPIPYLIASLAAYFLLWFGIPKARFLVSLLDAIDSGVRSAHQPVATLLAICGIIILSIPTITFMAAQVSVIYYFTRLRLGLKGGLLSLVGCLAVFASITVWMLLHPDLPPKLIPKLSALPLVQRLGFAVSTYHFGLLKMLMYAAILLLACSIGYLVSLRIKDRNLLLPVVMFAAMIDFWTVTAGPVASAMKHAPEIVSAVSAPIPKAGTGAFVPAVMMGIGDPLFMAVVFAAVHRLGLNPRRNFAFVFCVMTIAMIAVMMHALPYLPALVALAIAVVAANWREFKLSRQEKISTAVVAVVLLATLPLVWAIVTPKKTPRPKPPPPVSAPKPRR